MLLAEIRLDGSIERRKNLPPFLTVSRYLVPSPPSFSGMLFLSLSSVLIFLFFLSRFYSCGRQKRRAPSCRIWYVQANSSIERVTQGHPLKGDKRPSRKSNSRDRSNTNGPFPSFSDAEIPERLRFATRCLLRLASRLRVKRTLHIGTLQASPRDSDCLDEISSGSFIRSYTTVLTEKRNSPKQGKKEN